MEDTTRETQPAGRSISVLAFGDTVTELEIAALDEARNFFGTGVRLEIVPSYEVLPVRPDGSLAGIADGKKYHASMSVRIVEPA